jgi:hypothetical protein
VLCYAAAYLCLKKSQVTLKQPEYIIVAIITSVTEEELRRIWAVESNTNINHVRDREAIIMLPEQIVIENGGSEKQEQSLDGGSRRRGSRSSIGGHSNHGNTKGRSAGNILGVEPNGDGNQNPEDQALSAMTRQPTAARPTAVRPTAPRSGEQEAEVDDGSLGSGHSSTVGAARMNSVHRRRLRQQQEKKQGVNVNKSAVANAYSAAAASPGESQSPGGRAGNWREMYSVEVSTENGDDAEIVVPPPQMMTSDHSIPVHASHHATMTTSMVEEAGGDYSAGGVPTQIDQEVHMPPMQMQPHQQVGYEQQPHYAPHPSNGHYGGPPPGHYAVHQSHDEHYAQVHHHQDSYHDLYATPESKPNFAGCNVRFGDLEIRVYERILGDNPSCSSGPPVGIGWNFYSFTAPPSGAPSANGESFRDLSDPEDDSQDAGRNTRTELVVSLEKYERTRGPRCEAHDLVLARQMREELLVEAGYTRGQMADAVRQSLKVKHQRRQTVTNFKLEDAEEVIEKTTRTLKRLFMSGENRKKTRTSYLYMQWLEQSRHNGQNAGYSQQFAGPKSQSILVANDADKDRRNSTRQSGQIVFVDGPAQQG